MHIVIDLQGVQSESRTRGIGRYSEALAINLAGIAMPQHQVTLLLSGAFPHSTYPIRNAFDVLPIAPAFRVWQPLSPSRAVDENNAWRRGASEMLYTAVLQDLAADVVLVPSLFEGFSDDANVSIKTGTDRPLMAVVLHDLIPFINSTSYLENPIVRAWYHNRLAHLRRADLLLANSESSRNEALDYLGAQADRTVTISGASDARFRPLALTDLEIRNLRIKYELTRPFVMYTGGVDRRKNIEGLIEAFATMPADLSRQYQLVIVCSISENDRKRLQDFALRKGLEDSDLLLTGFIPDDDLVALYNLCALFVFPSKHEGFGLPALESMACGAPTLASNTSSLPEVVGWNEALFDPFETASISSALERGLTDQNFRTALKKHALEQSRKFSWDVTARRTLEELERLHEERNRGPSSYQNAFVTEMRRPRLAYVSPLQPAPSGISDYSADLLPELAAYYEIDVIVEQLEAVSDPWVCGNARQRSVVWFDAHAHEYDRILYHFGNSHFHQHMFGLLERNPGVVVLHDFFLSGVAVHREVTEADHGFWSRALVHSHGWEALHARFTVEDTADVIYAYPCNLEVLQRALGIIVHSNYSRRLAEQWYGESFGDDWTIIPLLRTPITQIDHRKAREALRISNDVFVVCAFGQMDKTKLNLNLIEAWNGSALSRDPNSLLIFVGSEEGGDYGKEVRSLLQVGQGRIQITGRVDEATYKSYLMATDVGVQLRTLSRGETSAAVLDCMNCGIPTVVNAHGSMDGLPRDAVLMLPDKFTIDELRTALERLKDDECLRRDLGARAEAYLRTHHKPRTCAKQYAQAIEQYHERAQREALGFIKDMRHLGAPAQSHDLDMLAERMLQIYPPKKIIKQQLLVDISHLTQSDAKTETQRVVRSVLRQLLQNPPTGFRIEPVFATHEHGYRYARRYTARFLGLGAVPLEDSPIYAAAGDIFWGLDFQPEVVTRHSESLHTLKQRGVRVVFTIYDLLPILLPETFSLDVAAAYSRWLTSMATSIDSLLCMSRTVARQVQEWLNAFGPSEGHALKLGWVHFGADMVEPSANDVKLAFKMRKSEQLGAIARYPSFLMVGTLEPRKLHAQALAAFESMWSCGVEVSLVIVGKQGVLMDEFAERLRTHPLRERYLFWLESSDDVMLEQVYSASACLLAASLDEGYGLPLVEAARHRLPILARDIPAFREVAGEHAQYFAGRSPDALAGSIREWLELYEFGKHPKSDAVSWMTWEQATREMLDLILQDTYQEQWTPRNDESLIARYWGSDPFFGTPAGTRKGKQICSNGTSGYLMHGPYLSTKPGRYVARIFGKKGAFGLGNAHAEICVKGGALVLAEQLLSKTETADSSMLAELFFMLDEAVSDLEVRVVVSDQSDLSISALEFRRANSQPATHAQAAALDPQKFYHNEKLKQWRYWATHAAMHTQVGYPDGYSLYTTGRAGMLIFGPYIQVPAGAYQVVFEGEAEILSGAVASIASACGAIIHRKARLIAIGNGQDQVLATLEFTLDAFVEDLEIQLSVKPKTRLRLDSVTLSEKVKSNRIVTNRDECLLSTRRAFDNIKQEEALDGELAINKHRVHHPESNSVDLALADSGLVGDYPIKDHKVRTKKR